ncbi:MAG: hypothetical protein OWQ54_03870 [Sulfolobaceae archaeon]|nr:hypothetical protein [Sulfolobaceae archaeon]
MTLSKILKSSILLSVFLISLVGLVAIQAPPATSYEIMYERETSQLVVANSTIMGMQPIIPASGIHYSVSSFKESEEVSGGGSHVVTGTIESMTLSLGSLTQYKGYIDISVNDFNITVNTSIPQLARIIIESYGLKELIWAGLTNSSASITTYSYLNKTGDIVLEFLNGTDFVNISLPIEVGKVYSLNETLSLVKVNVTGIIQTSFTFVIQNNFPRRYQPFQSQFNDYFANASAKEGYNVTIAYFNGTYVPAIVWKGEGIGSIASMFGHERFTRNTTFSFETIGFYGENGTLIGYLHDVYGSSVSSFSARAVSFYSNSVSGELKIVIGKGVVVKPAKALGVVEMNRVPVVVILNNRGEVESTAYVNLSHPVYIRQAGALAELSLNGTTKFVIVFVNNQTVNVTTVKPVNVTITRIAINGTAYSAQRVVVTPSGEYILFNVSLLTNTTEQPIVYKETSSGLVQVNSTNVFVTNGKVAVVDDPSTIYYVIYPSTATPVSTTTTSTSVTSSVSYTTTISTAISTTVTSSVSTITPTQVSSTSIKPSTNYTIIAVIAIVIIVIIAVVAIMIYRR